MTPVFKELAIYLARQHDRGPRSRLDECSYHHPETAMFCVFTVFQAQCKVLSAISSLNLCNHTKRRWYDHLTLQMKKLGSQPLRNLIELVSSTEQKSWDPHHGLPPITHFRKCGIHTLEGGAQGEFCWYINI